jgi:4-hydroxy-3-methylbut-2-enyl diphosphate reductase
MRTFEVPEFYKSPIISEIKNIRKDLDPKKKDFTPTVLDFGPVRFLIARHFGFCFGVENAIEISYKAIKENPNKRIYLLSEMIHNPAVNQDLNDHGIQFIMDTEGNQLISWDEVKKEDVVIIPAFGTTLEIEQILKEKEVTTNTYNTTCPFVERVWKMSKKLGEKAYTIVIHGKHNHEETRATFSHASKEGPAVIVKDMKESEKLAKYIKGDLSKESFYEEFKGKFSEGFDPEIHLKRIGVVNQTTMLATETKEIAAYLKSIVEERYGNDESNFADTRDSLCYATNDNQSATYGLLEHDADIAIVVGGYNSSNTTHLAELCEEKCPTYFVNSSECLKENGSVEHFNFHNKAIEVTDNFLPNKETVDVILTSGASCPDALVDEVLQKILTYFENTKEIETVISSTKSKYAL